MPRVMASEPMHAGAARGTDSGSGGVGGRDDPAAVMGGPPGGDGRVATVVLGNDTPAVAREPVRTPRYTRVQMMADLALQLMIVTLAALVPGLALAGVWRRAAPATPASEVLLASVVSLPVFFNVEVLALGLMPWDRPLDALRLVHAGVCVVCLGVTWLLRPQVTGVLRECGLGVRGNVATCGVAGGGVLLAATVSFGVALVWGVYNVPCAFDELGYQLSQSLQLLQDGRWGMVAGNSVWADSYPRGATTVFYWTMAIGGGDACIHPASAAGGVTLALATYVAGRRLRLDPRWSTLAAAMTLTTPVLFYLSTVGYIDLMVAGAVAALLAFALPQREGEWRWPSFAACLVAIVFALWMKVTVVAPIGVLVFLRGVWELGVRTQRVPTPSGARRPSLVGMIGVAVLAAGAGLWPYVRAYVVYGSPTWPVQLKFGPLVLFDGPLKTQQFMADSRLPLVQKLSEYWTNWFDLATADSRGGLGPLFLLAMVPASVVLAAAVVARPRRWGLWALPLAIFFVCPLAPVHHVPRYALYVVCPGALACAWIGQRLSSRDDESEVPAAWAVLLAVLCTFNTSLSLRDLTLLVRWQASLGFDLLTPDRNYEVVFNYWHRQPGYPTPETMRKLHEVTRPGELVAASAGGLMGLLHNRDYSYRVEQRPAAPWPVLWGGFHDLNHGIENQAAWLARQQADGVAVAMVYAGSVEDRALATPDSGFEVVHEQPAGDTAGIRIWRRKDR